MGLSDFCLPVLRTPFFVDNYFEKRGIRVFYAEERSTKNGLRSYRIVIQLAQGVMVWMQNCWMSSTRSSG